MCKKWDQKKKKDEKYFTFHFHVSSKKVAGGIASKGFSITKNRLRLYPWQILIRGFLELSIF